jgi:hypothetical protein
MTSLPILQTFDKTQTWQEMIKGISAAWFGNRNYSAILATLQITSYALGV